MQTLFFSSLNALMIIGMLRKMDMSLVRASFDLGASSGYTLWRIVVPLLKPVLLSCFLLSFIRSIADFGTPVVIGGRFETVSTEIYMQVIGYSRLDKSAALNVLLLIPTILVFILYRYLMQKNEKVISGNSNKTVEAGDTFRVRGLSAVIVWLGAGIFFVMMALEYGSIFLNSFSRNLRGKITFTTMYLDALLERNMDTFIRSVEYALIVAIVGSLIGILLSYYIERRKIKFGNRASCDTFCIFTAQAALCFFYCFVFVVSKTTRTSKTASSAASTLYRSTQCPATSPRAWSIRSWSGLTGSRKN